MDEEVTTELAAELQENPFLLNIIKVERVATLTPIRCRKIAPLLLHNNLKQTAWDKCDALKDEQKDANSTDDEKNELLSSSSDNDSTSLSTESEERLKPTCTYIDVPENKSKCDQLPFLTSLDKKCQSIEDESVSLHIRTSVRSKKNRRYHRFFCPPYFILAASILEISIFFWGGSKSYDLLVYSPHQRHEVWRFISYMLLHSGGIHLTLNIIIQMLLATILEMEQGCWRCAIVYIGGGVAGALGASVLQPTLYMVGASAGVYALLMSHLANVLLSFSEMKYRFFRIFAVGVLAASDIAFSAAHWWTIELGAPLIGWAAHCTGAAAGATLGILVYTGCDKMKFHVTVIQWLCFSLIVLGVTASVVINILVIEIP